MPRKKEIEEKLKTANVDIGDLIRIIRNDEQHEGVLMPHHEFSDDDIITLNSKQGITSVLLSITKQKSCLYRNKKQRKNKPKEFPMTKKTNHLHRWDRGDDRLLRRLSDRCGPSCLIGRRTRILSPGNL